MEMANWAKNDAELSTRDCICRDAFFSICNSCIKEMVSDTRGERRCKRYIAEIVDYTVEYSYGHPTYQ
jgi:hypothetical protein